MPESCKEGCYAETIAARFSDPGLWGHGFAKRTKTGARWTRKVSTLPEKLAEPLRIRKPQRIFVNSTSDLFHEDVPFEFIAAVAGVMAACPQHIFLSLTKRAERMLEFFEWLSLQKDRVSGWPSHTDLVANYATTATGREIKAASIEWPLPNWQLGVSAEDQQRWDERVPKLLECPAAFRFVSAEPLLSGILAYGCLAELDLLIAGAESGPGARPMQTV